MPRPAKQATTDHVPDDLLEAAGRLLPGHREVGTVAGSPDLIRVETINGPARVTRWESGTTQERIAAIHATLGVLQRAGVRFTPAPISGPNGEQSLTLPGGHRYEARGWLAGQSAGREIPLPGMALPAPISIDHVGEAARQLGRMHEGGRSAIAERMLPAAPLTAIHRATVTEARELRRRLIEVASAYPPARGWMNNLDRVVGMTADTIGTLQEGDERRFVVAHGDLWPEHLLFTRRDGAPELSGLAGWGQVAASSPLLDLAQLVSRTRGWSQDDVEAVVSGYQDTASLTPVERRAMPGIVALDLLHVSVRLLQRYLLPESGTERAYGETQLLVDALERTLPSLDTLIPIVGVFDSKTPKRGRKWNYGPPNPRRGSRE